MDMQVTTTDNGVNVGAMLEAKEAFAGAPEAAQFDWSATCEWMNLHFDTCIRRVAPWPDEIRARIADFADNQGQHPWPDEAGKRMHVRHPIFTANPDAS